MQNPEALFSLIGAKNESGDKVVTRWAKDCDINDLRPLNITTERDALPAILCQKFEWSQAFRAIC